MGCALFMEIHFVHPGVSSGPWKLRGDVCVHAPYAQSSCLAGSVHLSGKGTQLPGKQEVGQGTRARRGDPRGTHNRGLFLVQRLTS